MGNASTKPANGYSGRLNSAEAMVTEETSISSEQQQRKIQDDGDATMRNDGADSSTTTTTTTTGGGTATTTTINKMQDYDIGAMVNNQYFGSTNDQRTTSDASTNNLDASTSNGASSASSNFYSSANSLDSASTSSSSARNIGGNSGSFNHYHYDLSSGSNTQVNMLYASDNKKVTVDDFELLKVIGKGNFAKVMQVRKKDTGKVMAMKILNKEALKQRDQIEHTKTERRVLETIEHPFLVKLLYSFQTADKLYMVMEFINGGELFFHLKRDRRFKQDRARFYAAEILLALEHLHSKNIVYRDLKPENILMTKQGHICITDFGLSKDNLFNDRTHTFCGTPEYLAPEILLNQGHGRPVDFWSFGTLLYEMLVGIPPFYSENVQEMYDMILHSDLYIPEFVSVEASDLLARLLERNPKRRLGSGPRGVDEIKSHPFFNGIDWKLVYDKKYAAPFVPSVRDDLDLKYFEDEFTSEPAVDSVKESSAILGESVQKAFEGFTYTAEPVLNSKH